MRCPWHRDDVADGGRIIQLANDVSEQYEMLTGESINLFLDKDRLLWGDKWRERIDESLASVAYFIPVLTPRYFQSSECRRELQYFARKAIQLGIEELVLPLLYVDVPSLHGDNPDDDLVQLIGNYQWEDWRTLRFSDVTSSDYRRAVFQLASRLVDANTKAEAIEPHSIASQALANEEGDQEPGWIDLIVRAEESLPKWTETMSEISNEINTISSVMNEGTDKVKSTNTFAGRLLIARNIAHNLSEPSISIHNLANRFVSHIHDVDLGFREIFRRIADEIDENPKAASEVREFFETVIGLSEGAHRAFEALKSMIDTMSPLERVSRDLRPVIRRLRQGLTIMAESLGVTDDWVDLIASINATDDGIHS